MLQSGFLANFVIRDVFLRKYLGGNGFQENEIVVIIKILRRSGMCLSGVFLLVVLLDSGTVIRGVDRKNS